MQTPSLQAMHLLHPFRHAFGGRHTVGFWFGHTGQLYFLIGVFFGFAAFGFAVTAAAAIAAAAATTAAAATIVQFIDDISNPDKLSIRSSYNHLLDDLIVVVGSFL